MKNNQKVKFKGLQHVATCMEDYHLWQKLNFLILSCYTKKKDF